MPDVILSRDKAFLSMSGKGRGFDRKRIFLSHEVIHSQGTPSFQVQSSFRLLRILLSKIELGAFIGREPRLANLAESSAFDHRSLLVISRFENIGLRVVAFWAVHGCFAPIILILYAPSVEKTLESLGCSFRIL